MPPFGLQRRRSKSPDKFRRKTNSYERRPSIASASSATEAFLQNVNQQDSGSSQYSQHEINGQRKALPDLRKGKHTTPQPVIQGNAFRNSNLARLEQTAENQPRKERNRGSLGAEKKPLGSSAGIIGTQIPPSSIAVSVDHSLHPLQRTDSDQGYPSRFLSFVHNIIPRSPTKDRLDATLSESYGYTRTENERRQSVNTIDEETSPSTPSRTDSDRPTSKQLESLIETPSQRKAQTKVTESPNTTPSKAAKLLGLSDDQYTPSKATRILGSGLEGDEEMPKRQLRHRMSSGEFLPYSPSRRMARIIEGAAAKFSRHRNSVDLSDLREEKYDPDNDGHLSKPIVSKILRTPSLKYMDNNSIPPTPPDKDTIYRLSRSESTKQPKVNLQEVFKGDSAPNTDNKPVYKGEKASLKASLVPKPSIYSMSGVIESNSRYSTVKSASVKHQFGLAQTAAEQDIFVTPLSNSRHQEPMSSTMTAELPVVDSSPDSASDKAEVNSSIHPSAIPTPLYSSRNTIQEFIAPPDDLLTHFDVVNCHVLRATNAVMEQIHDAQSEQIQRARRMHAESINTINEQFNEVYERIRAVENDVGRLVGSVSDSQESLTTKLDSLATKIQSDLVRRLDEELFVRSEIVRKVDQMGSQVQAILEVLKARPTPESSSSSARPTNSASGSHYNGNYNMSPVFSVASNRSAGHPSEGWLNPAQLAMLNSGVYSASGPSSIPQSSHNFLNEIYGGPRVAANGNQNQYSSMVFEPGVPSQSLLHHLHQKENNRINGHANGHSNHHNDKHDE